MALIFGTLGNDSLVGTGKSDSISGGPAGNPGADKGRDTLIGGGGADTINGEGGNDSIVGGGGGLTSIALLIGGDGDDRIEVFVKGTVGGGEGNDTIVASGGTSFFDEFSLNGEGGDDLIRILSPNPAVVFANGGAGQDTLLGSDSRDGLGGDADRFDHGADLLEGNGGDDGLSSFGGADTLDGGGGIDIATIDRSAAGGRVRMLAGPQDAAIQFNDGTVLIDVERFVLTGGDRADRLRALGADDSVFGGAGNDRLRGGRGSDFLQGGDGEDTLMGGAGSDLMQGQGGADTFRWRMLDRTTYDFISGFDGTADRLEFSAAALGGLLPIGTLDPASLAFDAPVGEAPQFVFRTLTRLNSQLSWDADGSGAGKAVVIARISFASDFSADDIVIIA